jgi:hypothetical protein
MNFTQSVGDDRAAIAVLWLAQPKLPAAATTIPAAATLNHCTNMALILSRYCLCLGPATLPWSSSLDDLRANLTYPFLHPLVGLA